jgi:hypothetical protein
MLSAQSRSRAQQGCGRYDRVMRCAGRSYRRCHGLSTPAAVPGAGRSVEAPVRLRARICAEDRFVAGIADDIVAGRLRFDRIKP